MLQKRVHGAGRGHGRQRAVASEVARVGRDEGHVALGEQQHRHEGRQHERGDGERAVIERARILARGEHEHRVEHGNEPCPEQKRALAPRPKTGELVEPRLGGRGGGAVVQHVLDGVVAREEAPHEHGAAHRERHRREHRGHPSAPGEGVGALEGALLVKDMGHAQAQHRDDAAGKGHEQAEKSDHRHGLALQCDIGGGELAVGAEGAREHHSGTVGDPVGKRAL